LLYQFKEQLQRLCNHEEALLHHPKVDSFTLQCVQEEITHLRTKIDGIVKEIRDIIDRDYGDYLELIKSVPGFGDTTAQAVIEAIQSFQGFEEDTKGRAFIKFVGLAPTIFRSGTSVRGRSHINRATGSDLRKILGSA
jgi:transposase